MRDLYTHRSSGMFKFIQVMVVFTILISFGWIAFQAYVGIKAINAIEAECKDGLAKCLGRTVKDFKDGMEGL